MTPSLSILVPVYNAAATLPDQLAALRASIDDDMEVILIDNRSTDGSREITHQAAQSDRRFRCVDAADRQGEPHARNVGISAALADLIAFCDADDVVAPTWPAAMRDALCDSEFVTGPVELELLNPPWLAGVRGRSVFANLPRTWTGTPFAHGCNIGIQRALAERVGGFDEAVLIGCDIDFAIRAHAAGAKLTWKEDAVVHYRHRTGARQRWRQAISYGRAAHHLRVLEGAEDRLGARTRRQMRRVGWLFKGLPGLAKPAHRAQWQWTLGLVVGEIAGSER